MATIINTKLGEHRGRKRVWLEGQKLVREGYQPGMRFDAEFDSNKRQVMLRTNTTNGKYTVSKRNRQGKTMPIIDLTAAELASMFSGIALLRVAIRRGQIAVTAHHIYQLVQDRVTELYTKLYEQRSLSVCSLFHGGGVLDKSIHHGLQDAGVKSSVDVVVELESKYLDSSLENNPELFNDDSIIIESPVQMLNLSRGTPKADIVVGGIPCTGASKSGRSKNKLEFAESHSAAGALFFSFLEFVKASNPAIVVIENVPEYQNTASMEVIRSVLGSLEYEVYERVLDGNEFGALEKRKRLCAIAVTKGLHEGFDLNDVLPLRQKENCLGEILEAIPHDSERWRSFDYLAEKELRDKAAGKGFARQLLTEEAEYCGTIGKDYAKCRSTEPFIVHPVQSNLSRLLTPSEHCRVKGIPESIIQGLSDTTAHQILGQSIIYPMFEAVARYLGKHLINQVNLLALPDPARVA